MPYSTTNRFVAEAARRIHGQLVRASGGRLPRTASGWCRLCARSGVPASPLPACPARFTARLERDERLLDGWFVTYNANAEEAVICRWLAHELAEFVAIGDYPTLFDGLPRQVYHYTGGDDPADARHRIARRVEELCFRRS